MIISSRTTAKLLLSLFTGSLLISSIWYLVQYFEWHEAFASINQINFIKLVGLIFVIHVTYLCVRTWRWLIVVRVSNPDIRFHDLYWISAVFVSLSIVTPGQLGEALKIELLKQRGLLERLPSLGGFALERILDLVVVAGMGVIGLVSGSDLLGNSPEFKYGVLTLFLLSVLILCILWLIKPERLPTLWLKRIRAGSGSPIVWVKMGLLTVLCWILIALGWQVSLNAVGISLPVTEIIWLISLVTVGTMLSLIPGGVGIAEVMTIHTLNSMGVDPIMAQTGAIILRIYAIMTIFIGLSHLLVLFRIPRVKTT